MTKLNPAGHRVLIRPDKIEEEQLIDGELNALKQAGFKIEKPDGQMRRDKQGTDSGVVIAIGPTAWKAPQYGYGSPEWAPWAKVGDRVTFGRYCGKMIDDPATGEQDAFMVINDDDIQLVLTEE